MRYLFTFLLSVVSLPSFAQHDAIAPTTEFKITGMVKNELHITMSSLLQYKQDTLNDVVFKSSHGTEKDKPMQLKGVLLKTLLDSAHISAANHKEYGELFITLIASDNYKNMYSWNELFNTEVGNHVYVITEMDGTPMSDMKDRILVMSLSDFNSGRRHLKALSKIEVRNMP